MRQTKGTDEMSAECARIRIIDGGCYCGCSAPSVLEWESATEIGTEIKRRPQTASVEIELETR